MARSKDEIDKLTGDVKNLLAQATSFEEVKYLQGIIYAIEWFVEDPKEDRNEAS